MKKIENKKSPSAQDIIDRKLKYYGFIDKLENNDFKVEDKKETITSKLDLISDGIKRYKDANISYRIMCQHIEENIGLKISEQSLRLYCQNVLNFPKGRKNKKSNVDDESIVNSSSEEAFINNGINDGKLTKQENDNIDAIKKSISEKNTEDSTPKEPLCPKCNNIMVLRTVKNSPNTFWGCPAYPQCKGTLPAS